MDKLPEMTQQLFGGTTSQRIVLQALDDIKNQIKQFDVVAQKIVNNLLTNICTKFEEELSLKISEIVSLKQGYSNITDANARMVTELELLCSENDRLATQLQKENNNNKQLTKELTVLREDVFKQKKSIFELQSCKIKLENTLVQKQNALHEKLMDIEEEMSKLNQSYEKQKIKSYALQEKIEQINNKWLIEIEKNQKLSESITFTNEKLKILQSQIIQSNQSKKMPSEQNRSFDTRSKNNKKLHSMVNRLSQSVYPMRQLQFDSHTSQKQGKASIKSKNKVHAKNQEKNSIKYGNQLIVSHQKRISNAESINDSERIRKSKIEDFHISRVQDVKSIFTDRVKYRIEAQKKYGEKYDRLRSRLRKSEEKCERLQYLLNLLKKQYKKKGRLTFSLLYMGDEKSNYFAKHDENNPKQSNSILSEGLQILNSSYVLSQKPQNDEQSPQRMGIAEDLGSMQNHMSINRQDQFLNFSHLSTKMRHHYLNSKLQGEEDISFRNQETIMNESNSLSRSKHLAGKYECWNSQGNQQFYENNILQDDSLGKNEENIIKQCQSIDLSPQQNNQIPNQVHQSFDLQIPCDILSNRLATEKILNTSILQTQRIHKNQISKFQMFFSQECQTNDNDFIKIADQDAKHQFKMDKVENFTFNRPIDITIQGEEFNSKITVNKERGIDRQFIDFGIETEKMQELLERKKQILQVFQSTNTDITLKGDQWLNIIQNTHSQYGLNTDKQEHQEESTQTLEFMKIQEGVNTDSMQMIHPREKLHCQQISINTDLPTIEQQGTMTVPTICLDAFINTEHISKVDKAIETVEQDIVKKTFKDFSLQTKAIMTNNTAIGCEIRQMKITRQIQYKELCFAERKLKISEINFITVRQLKQKIDSQTETEMKLSVQPQLINIKHVQTLSNVEQQNDEDQFKSIEQWDQQKDQSQLHEIGNQKNKQITEQIENQVSFGRRRSSSLQIKRQVTCMPTISITEQKQKKNLKISPQLFQDKKSQFLTYDGQISTENKKQRSQLYRSEMFTTEGYVIPIFEKNSRITNTTCLENVNNSFFSSPQHEKDCNKAKSQCQYLSDLEISSIKAQFNRLKSFQEIKSVHLYNGQEGKHIFQRMDGLFIFNTEKNNQKSKFIYWKGKILYFGTRKQSMYMPSLKETKLKNRNDFLILGNSEVTIIKNKLSINLGNKVRIFKGQMQEGQWKIADIRVYKTQTFS